MLHRFFHFLKQSLLVVLCILLLWRAAGRRLVLFYQGRTAVPQCRQQLPSGFHVRHHPCRGSYTSYDALPQIYINAVICTEDEHFRPTKGIDPGAIARALLADLRTHSLAEAGSTLPSSLPRTSFSRRTSIWPARLPRCLLLFDIEKDLLKQQIFEMYANTIYFGSGYYGIAEAAEGLLWQGTGPADRCRSDLSGGYAQRAPSTYASSPELTFKRMQVVLKRMVKCRVLTQQQADAIAADAENLTV